MSGIIINKDIINEVYKTGENVSTVLEKTYSKEIAAKRKENPAFEGLSATKLALLDTGIDGSCRVEKLFTTNDSDILFPAYITDLVDTTVKGSDIMKHMVSNELPVDGRVIKAPVFNPYSKENKAALSKSRVAEGADIPIKTIKLGEKNIDLYKKAIAISQTYEAAKYMRIDLFSIMAKAVANDIVEQNIAEIVSTVETSNVYDLGETAAADAVTAEELFDACMEYALKYKYAPTTVVANGEMYKSIAKLVYKDYERVGATVRLKINTPQLGNMEISVIRADVAKVNNKNAALIYNKDKSVYRLVANGSNISEAARNIQNQTNLATLSEISGYGVLIDSVGRLVSA